jgi:uncharacterized protein (TIGR04255 family)
LEFEFDPISIFRMSEYLDGFPSLPESLPFGFSNFFHQDIVSIPGYNYAGTITKAYQPPQAGSNTIAFIFDIGVFSTIPTRLDDDLIEKQLNELRWLKNAIFFRSIKSKMLEALT